MHIMLVLLLQSCHQMLNLPKGNMSVFFPTWPHNTASIPNKQYHDQAMYTHFLQRKGWECAYMADIFAAGCCFKLRRCQICVNTHSKKKHLLCCFIAPSHVLRRMTSSKIDNHGSTLPIRLTQTLEHRLPIDYLHVHAVSTRVLVNVIIFIHYYCIV